MVLIFLFLSWFLCCSYQEVVPLNAGNILGAEDNRPIPKWESLIRRTLNKTSEPKANYKSLSAPPSPIFRSPSTLDALAIEADIPSIAFRWKKPISKAKPGVDLRNQERKGRNGEETKSLIKRIYGIDSDRRIEWPGHSVDTLPSALSSSLKLRQVLRSSGRIGFSWLENPLAFDPNFAPNGDGLKRLHSDFGNLMADQAERLEDSPDSASDACDEISAEEDESFLGSQREFSASSYAKDVNKHPRYVRIVSKQMVGIYISVWVRKKLRRHITYLKVSPVGVGLMGYMGNKVLFKSISFEETCIMPSTMIHLMRKLHMIRIPLISCFNVTGICICQHVPLPISPVLCLLSSYIWPQVWRSTQT